jgi:hypothetical protein
MRTIRLMWATGPNAVEGWQLDVDQEVLDAGEFEPENIPAPAGTFRLMPEEFWRTIGMDDPMPIFLHESYEANIEKWIKPLSAGDSEVAVVGEVRDAVIELVNQRLSADPRATSISSTVTSTEMTPQGRAVVGRCIVLRPRT